MEAQAVGRHTPPCDKIARHAVFTLILARGHYPDGNFTIADIADRFKLDAERTEREFTWLLAGHLVAQSPNGRYTITQAGKDIQP